MQDFAARAYPFIRMGDTGLAPPPEGRLLTIAGAHGPSERRVDGFSTPVPQCTLQFLREPVESLVTGSVVRLRCETRGFWGEFIPLELLDRDEENVHILGYHVYATTAYPLVAYLPWRYSQVLSRQDVFGVFQRNVHPSVAIRDMYARAANPRRWAHMLASMRIYTIESLLVLMGREDILKVIPSELRRWLMAPPEMQNFATNLLFGFTPSRGPLPRI
ncbi:hypothetical protein K523DRAFT_319892 [Schizophyllum commune Tattone D]|nr:hypothetical protein K523DRAFT_319892 [Schizophyllum commune Tattone D]